MNRFTGLSLLLVVVTGNVFGQLNFTLNGRLDYSAQLSDIWGYADPAGNEYALIGLFNGVSVVNISDPANPQEVFFEPGPNTGWRELKTWDKYAYVTNEASGGLMIIDLSNLPDTNLSVTYYTAGNWETAHNLFIDENGICYIYGSDRGNGGVIILDIASDPLNPVEIGAYDAWYAHDGMVSGDTLYVAHINDGWFSVMDVSDKSNVQVLATQQTPSNTSHNIWVSDDGNYVFTTDEVSGAYLTAYDISDLGNIRELDRAQSSPGSGVIPHNTFFINNYLVTSYYNDGITIHDVSDPGNMVKTGWYDTTPLEGNGFTGAWGTYPWLPSGRVIVSDVIDGLYILTPNYVRGCYLRGTVTDAVTTIGLNDVSVTILNSEGTELTGLTGQYAAGTALAGSYDVVFRKGGYEADTISDVSLSTGNVTTLDVALDPLVSFAITGLVVNGTNGVAIPDAKVRLKSADYLYELTADGNGNIFLPEVFQAEYDVYAGNWGFVTNCDKRQIDAQHSNLVIELQPGYYDDFTLDLGWTISGHPSKAPWESGIPYGTSFGPIIIHPDMDAVGDCGGWAYTTGNNGDVYDELNGATILTSPVFDASIFSDPYISFFRWFFDFNQTTQSAGNDSLTVYLSDGSSTVLIDFVVSPSFPDNSWRFELIRIADHLTPTPTMQVIFRVEDKVSRGNDFVEAGIDIFRVTDGPVSGIAAVKESARLNIFPNPFNETLNVSVNWESVDAVDFDVFDAQGKKIIELKNINTQTITAIPLKVPGGIYWVRASYNGRSLETIPVIKM